MPDSGSNVGPVNCEDGPAFACSLQDDYRQETNPAPSLTLINPAEANTDAALRDVDECGETSDTTIPYKEPQPAIPAKKFLYTPLDSSSRCIRLLEVLPGDDTDVIRCDLREVMLNDKPAYVALSYTWDLENRTAYIECKGERLQIGQNLWNFLHRFRRRNRVTQILLWIDAICINQSNIGERNHQVAQMRDIYMDAASVIVWLGADIDSATSTLAFDLVTGSRKLQLDKGEDLRRYRSKKQWRALYILLNEPHYWSRVWIIQEFILAKSVDIWCGEHSAGLDHFESLCRYLKRLQKSSMPHPESSGVLASRGWTLCEHRSQWPRYEKGDLVPSTFRLQNLLQAYAKSQSSDVRDKVYALLGIACDATRTKNPIIADYAKAPMEVLVDVIRNQCRWDSLSARIASYTFINLLCKTFEISSAALMLHVLQNAPDLHSHISVLTIKNYVYAPLRSVGIIVDSTCARHDDGSSRQQCQQRKLDWPLPWRPNTKHESQPRSVTVELAESVRDVRTRNILRTDVSEFRAKDFYPPKGFAEAGCLQTLASVGNSDDSDVVTFGDGKWYYSGQDMSNLHATLNTESCEPEIQDRETNDDLNVFVGSEDLIGITSTLVQQGDVVCTAAEDTSRESAIIMRQRNDRSGWASVGLAIIPRKTDSPTIPSTPNVQTRSEISGHVASASARLQDSSDRFTASGNDEQDLFVCGDRRDRQTDELILSTKAHNRLLGKNSRGFVIFQDDDDGYITWRVKPRAGCEFKPREQRSSYRQWLCLFFSPACVPKLAKIRLLSRAFLSRYSGFGAVQRGNGPDTLSTASKDNTSGLDCRSESCRSESYETETSSHSDPSGDASAAVSMGAVPLPSFSRRESRPTWNGGLRLPSIRPDWPIPDPTRQFNDD